MHGRSVVNPGIFWLVLNEALKYTGRARLDYSSNYLVRISFHFEEENCARNYCF